MKFCVVVRLLLICVLSPLEQPPSVGSRKGLRWTICGHSDTSFPHLTVIISKTVTHNIVRQFELNVNSNLRLVHLEFFKEGRVVAP